MQYLTDVSNLKIAKPTMPWEERGGDSIGVLQFFGRIFVKPCLWVRGRGRRNHVYFPEKKSDSFYFVDLQRKFILKSLKR